MASSKAFRPAEGGGTFALGAPPGGGGGGAGPGGAGGGGGALANGDGAGGGGGGAGEGEAGVTEGVDTTFVGVVGGGEEKEAADDDDEFPSGDMGRPPSFFFALRFLLSSSFNSLSVRLSDFPVVTTALACSPGRLDFMLT